MKSPSANKADERTALMLAVYENWYFSKTAASSQFSVFKDARPFTFPLASIKQILIFDNA
jgi:hypothetical protein